MLQVIQDVLTQPVSNIETKIAKYRELKLIAKSIDTEMNRIKDELIETYFCHFSEYVNEQGMTLATYKQAERTSLDTNAIKKEMPEIFQQYSVKNHLLHFQC